MVNMTRSNEDAYIHDAWLKSVVGRLLEFPPTTSQNWTVSCQYCIFIESRVMPCGYDSTATRKYKYQPVLNFDKKNKTKPYFVDDRRIIRSIPQFTVVVSMHDHNEKEANQHKY